MQGCRAAHTIEVEPARARGPRIVVGAAQHVCRRLVVENRIHELAEPPDLDSPPPSPPAPAVAETTRRVGCSTADTNGDQCRIIRVFRPSGVLSGRKEPRWSPPEDVRTLPRRDGTGTRRGGAFEEYLFCKGSLCKMCISAQFPKHTLQK